MADNRIPLIKADLPALESLESSFREILGNGRVTNFGPYVQQFEAEAGAYLGTEAVCLSSATAGLIMTLQALGVARGSRVVMPSFSFVATAQAVLYAGCTPVFVDIAEDGNVDPYDLARVLQHQAGHDAHRLIALTPAIELSTRERARRAGFERWLVTPVVQSDLDDLLVEQQTLLTE